MKKSVIVVTSLLVGTFCFGQAGTFGFTNTQISTHQYFEQYGIVEGKLHAIKGTPYDSPVFLPGTIYSSNEVVGAGVMLRYNVFADEIEIKDPTSDNYSSLIKSPEFFAKINNDIYLYVLGENGGYFKVLTEGKSYDLYKRSTVTYQDAIPPKDSYGKETPAQFSRHDTYYIVSKGGSFYELPNNRKKFVSIFKSNQKEIDQYIKKNKINLKQERDMIKVMNYIDGLITE